MAVEILRHEQSGEYYAVQYDQAATDAHGNPRYACNETISQVCGPLTRDEAAAIIRAGECANLRHEGAAWAHSQPWATIDIEDFLVTADEEALDAYNQRTLPVHSADAVRAYIETYYDPQATLASTDDPADTLSHLDNLCSQQDGFPTPLSYADVRDYLASLATIGR